MATQSNRSMVSETSICNQALAFLGQDPIISLDQDSTSAEWMKNNYPFIRDALLETRMWTFTTARASSTSQDKDEWGTLYVHPIPLNWMSVYRCYQDVSTYSQGTIDKTWRVEGGNVLSAYSTVYLWGMTQITDTNRFSSLFVQALAARLAADAAVPMTENRVLSHDLWNLYSLKLGEAAARDGAQGGSDTIISNTLIDARRGGR